MGTGAELFGAATANPLGDTKNTESFQENAGLNKYKALCKQPRPEVAALLFCRPPFYSQIPVVGVLAINSYFLIAICSVCIKYRYMMGIKNRMFRHL
jgi:hypothetical protein